MKAHIIVSALLATLLSAPFTFAETAQPSTTPQISSPPMEEVIAQFKKSAGGPFAVGVCDKDKEDGTSFNTHVIFYQLEGIHFFEIENGEKKFAFIRLANGKPVGFFQELNGKFSSIPLDEMYRVLTEAGAPEFVKTINPADSSAFDCVAKQVSKGTAI